MPQVPLNLYLELSAALFITGAVGFLLRRNPLTMLMAIELMWNAGNLAFIAFARDFVDMTGQVFAFLLITVAAEAAISLAIVVMVFRRRDNSDVDDISIMRG